MNRSSLSFWIGEDVIRDWKQDKQNKRERTHRFSDRPIATALTLLSDSSQCHCLRCKG
ncbi:TPA: transposase [Vibrio metschnikovii]